MRAIVSSAPSNSRQRKQQTGSTQSRLGAACLLPNPKEKRAQKAVKLCYGTPEEIEKWMELVHRVRWNFPGLETQAGAERTSGNSSQIHGKAAGGLRKRRGGDGRSPAVFTGAQSDLLPCGCSRIPQARGRFPAHGGSIGQSGQDEGIITAPTFRADDEKGIAPRALYQKYGFVPGKLIEEFGYPNQELALHPTLEE